MRELSSEKIKSAFALVNLGNQRETDVEHSTKFIPGLNVTSLGDPIGENVKVVFLHTTPVGK